MSRVPPPRKGSYGNIRTGFQPRQKSTEGFLGWLERVDRTGGLVGDEVSLALEAELIQRPRPLARSNPARGPRHLNKKDRMSLLIWRVIGRGVLIPPKAKLPAMDKVTETQIPFTIIRQRGARARFPRAYRNR